MGTNYYIEASEPCECCGRPLEGQHIGKSSGGWCFSLHVDPDAGINDLPDWMARWSLPGARIVDEYGQTIEPDEMLEIILNREGPHSDHRGAKFYAENIAEAGPKGLLRHRVGRFCVGHGDGTYDLIPGEFS